MVRVTDRSGQGGVAVGRPSAERRGQRVQDSCAETLTFWTTKSSVSPPVAAVKTRSALGGRSATDWSGALARLPRTRSTGCRRIVTTTWVVAPWRVGIVELVATQLGMPDTGPPSAMPTKLADGSAPCLKLARPTATPRDPRVAERAPALTEEGGRCRIGEGQGHAVGPGAATDGGVEGHGQVVRGHGDR